MKPKRKQAFQKNAITATYTTDLVRSALTVHTPQDNNDEEDHDDNDDDDDSIIPRMS